MSYWSVIILSQSDFFPPFPPSLPPFCSKADPRSGNPLVQSLFRNISDDFSMSRFSLKFISNSLPRQKASNRTVVCAALQEVLSSSSFHGKSPRAPSSLHSSLQTFPAYTYYFLHRPRLSTLPSTPFFFSHHCPHRSIASLLTQNSRNTTTRLPTFRAPPFLPFFCSFSPP